jgi:hypothetical protein
VPRGSVEVVIVATPEVFNVALPMVVLPRLKVTVPPGVPAVEATVAVRVTGDPNVDEFGDEVRVVVVGATFTVWLRVGEVLVALLGLRYTQQ